MLGPIKHGLRRALRRCGYDLRRLERSSDPSLADFLRAEQIDLVLDVGANEGQFARGLRHGGYGGEIVSFEPIPTVFQKLRENARGDRRWHLRQEALGDRTGTAEIAVTAHSVFSSMKPQSARLDGLHPGIVSLGEIDCVFRRPRSDARASPRRASRAIGPS
jgi:FkbM family methyltransferase